MIKNKKSANSPLVDIVILNWNGVDDTLKCLKSLKKINYSNYKIWILDNGSTKDNSVEVLSNLSKKDEINFIDNKANKGYAMGCNRLISSALKANKNGYILLLNNDTIVEPDFLEKLVDVAQSSKTESIVGPAIYQRPNKLSWDDYPGYFKFLIGGSGRELNMRSKVKRGVSFEVGYLSGCCWLIKKDMLKKIGLFEKNYFTYYEEIEWAYRIKNRGYKFLLVPTSVIYHKGHATSSKLTGFQLYYQNRNLIWFEKEYATKKQYFIYRIYLFLYKIPKTILLNFIQMDKSIEKTKRFLEGIYDGLMGVNSEKRIGFYKM
jgi:GT2 family glycosyltransferase